MEKKTTLVLSHAWYKYINRSDWLVESIALDSVDVSQSDLVHAKMTEERRNKGNNNNEKE